MSEFIPWNSQPLDLWGFGYSTREPLDYGYQLYVDQVLLFMDSLGINRTSLVGQSMGGSTAILFCVQHRERVNNLYTPRYI